MKLEFYHEPSRDTPVFRDVDVLIAGGGTSGMIAGLASARAGAKTLVLERLNVLGGNFTAGLMTTTWTMNDQKKIIVKGIPLEIIEKLEKAGATIKGDKSKETFVNYDAEYAKYVIMDMYRAERNLEVLLYAYICEPIIEGEKVKGVIIESKSGRHAILAKVIVDATGDADVAARAGSEYMMAPLNKLHPVSLLAKVANVDVEELNSYYGQHPDYIGDFLRGSPYSGFHSFGIKKELEGISLPADLEYLRDWFILYYSTPRKGEFIINMTGDTSIDGTNVEQITKGEFTSRMRLQQCLEVFKKYIPGFKNAYFTSSASVLGVRETRRIVGRHILNKQEVLNNQKFDDAICSYHAPVAVHTADGKGIEFIDLKPGTSYDIPFRCLLPKNLEGIIVTGRCISVEADIIGTTRNMTACMALGQGAGVAAALSATKGILPSAIENKDLINALLSQNVYLEGKC